MEMYLIMCMCIAMCIGGGSGSPTGVELYGTPDRYERVVGVYKLYCRKGRVLVPSAFTGTDRDIYMDHAGKQNASIWITKDLGCGLFNSCWEFMFNCVDASSMYEVCPRYNSHLVIEDQTCGYIKHCSTDDTGCTDCSINIKAPEGHTVHIYNYYDGGQDWAEVDRLGKIESRESRSGKEISLQSEYQWLEHYEFLFKFHVTSDNTSDVIYGSDCSVIMATEKQPNYPNEYPNDPRPTYPRRNFPRPTDPSSKDPITSFFTVVQQTAITVGIIFLVAVGFLTLCCCCWMTDGCCQCRVKYLTCC